MSETPEFVKLPDGTITTAFEAYFVWKIKAGKLEASLASARAIMQRFVDKVDNGRARSTETYAEMKEWLDS